MSPEEYRQEAPSTIEQAVRKELICLLFGSPAVPLINGLAVVLTAGALWRIFPLWASVPWVIASLSIVLVRVLLWSQFKKKEIESRHIDRWARRFMITTAMIGCLWGLVASITLVAPESIYYFFAAFVVGGLSAGAAIRNSPHPPAFYAFIGTSAPPMILGLFLGHGLMSQAMGLLLLVFITVMIIVGRENYQRLHDYIRMKIEQEMAIRAQAERQLELEEAQRLAHIGNWSYDPQSGVSTWSQELFRMFGQDHALPPPSPREFERLLEPESFAHLTAAIQNCVEREAAFEIDLRLKIEAAAQWVSMRGEPRRGASENIHLRGTCQDITARRGAEALAREQESMFRSLVEQNMSGILIISEEKNVIYLNPAALEMIGCADETLVLGLPALEMISYLDKQPAEDAMNRLITGNEREEELSIVVHRMDGKTIDVLAKAAPMTFKGRQAIITVLVDITERRRAEEEIVKLNKQMADTLEALRRRERDLTTTAKLSDLLQSCRTVMEAYSIIGDVAAMLFPRESGFLAMWNEDTWDLTQVSAWGPHQSTAAPRFEKKDCLAIETDRDYEFGGAEGETQCAHLPGSNRPHLCLPLKVQGVTRGVVTLVLNEGDSFDDAARQALHSFADVVKLSLANLQLRDSLAEQALRDPLTGLFNRRYLMEILPREIGRAQRHGTPLTVAMLDIDHFKRFNDLYGHDAGDLVLVELAVLFSGVLRADDVACRYGGEEFLLLMPGCHPAAAFQRLTEITFKVKNKATVFCGKTLPGTSLSIGLATLGERLSTSESLITAADKALYAAKRLGRDRIELFETAPEPERYSRTAEEYD